MRYLRKLLVFKQQAHVFEQVVAGNGKVALLKRLQKRPAHGTLIRLCWSQRRVGRRLRIAAATYHDAVGFDFAVRIFSGIFNA